MPKVSWANSGGTSCGWTCMSLNTVLVKRPSILCKGCVSLSIKIRLIDLLTYFMFYIKLSHFK